MSRDLQSSTLGPNSPGRIPKWPTGADCKSAGLRLRWFESIFYHHLFNYNDKVFNGIRDSGDSFVLSISTVMYQAISNTFGDKVFDCPNMYPFFLPASLIGVKSRYQTGTGYYIGYQYHGGRIMPAAAGWKSPIKLTDLPVNSPTNAPSQNGSLVLFSDMNSWAANGVGGYNWVTAPHGKSVTI